MSTRAGGVSRAPFDSFNLGIAVGDAAAAVDQNRRRFADQIGAQPVWLRQVHGCRVVRVGSADVGGDPIEADGAWTDEAGIACTVQVADCLPLLFAAPGGRAVAAVHAGWRGLAGGVVEATIDALCAGAGCTSAELCAWIGPGIGPRHFEVGADVLHAFDAAAIAADQPHSAFAPRADGSPRWLADLPALAARRLRRAGLTQVQVRADCTFSDASRYFSFRRDGITGRLAAAVWRRG